MFSLEDDSGDEEEKVHEGSLSKSEGVCRGKAPAGILVSYVHRCVLCLLAQSGWLERRPGVEGASCSCPFLANCSIIMDFINF